MNKYEVTITRTGSIIIEAESENQAIDILNSMTAKEISAIGNLIGWESSDIELINE